MYPQRPLLRFDGILFPQAGVELVWADQFRAAPATADKFSIVPTTAGAGSKANDIRIRFVRSHGSASGSVDRSA
jgi:hypothetical protein